MSYKSNGPNDPDYDYDAAKERFDRAEEAHDHSGSSDSDDSSENDSED